MSSAILCCPLASGVMMRRILLSIACWDGGWTTGNPALGGGLVERKVVGTSWGLCGGSIAAAWDSVAEGWPRTEASKDFGLFKGMALPFASRVRGGWPFWLLVASDGPFWLLAAWGSVAVVA